MRRINEFMSDSTSLYEATVIYAYLLEFKAVVHLFSANGAMKDSLLGLLKVNSVQSLRDSQEPGHAVHSLQLSDEALLTLTAIKILNQNFGKDKKLWNLVERKARKFLLANASMTKESLEAALIDFRTFFVVIKQ